MIPLKIVSQECCKLADEFIPELVDTLASQMNPQVVCSVAGLCNNVHIDKLLEQRGVENLHKSLVNQKPTTCQGCHAVIGILENKFDKMSRDQVLQSFIQVNILF